jgi:polyhydroxyalkanoate synthase
VNPPAAKKYGYFTGSKIDVDAKTWLDSAKLNQGSWWPEWNRWAKKYAGEKVPARSPGDGGLPVIEDAPGSYVKKRY